MAEDYLRELLQTTSAPLEDLLPKRGTWDERFMSLAHHVASWSKDPSTQVGAVIVGTDKRHVALGYNGFPPGIADKPERLFDRATRLKLTQHAERNVLDNAQFDVSGGTLYVTMFPCSECAKSAVSRGVKKIVCPRPVDRDPWREDAKWSALVLVEGGVDVVYDDML